MPYIYTQAHLSSEAGHPMTRTMFFEFPEDEGSWYIEDQYMLGSQLLVAPLFEEEEERKVYLPPGSWVDYQTGKSYEGAGWQVIEAGTVPIILLVRGGSIIPHAPLAQSTEQIDWSSIYFEHYPALAKDPANKSYFYHPKENKRYELEIDNKIGQITTY